MYTSYLDAWTGKCPYEKSSKAARNSSRIEFKLGNLRIGWTTNGGCCCLEVRGV
jgi:hypothetical protein